MRGRTGVLFGLAYLGYGVTCLVTGRWIHRLLHILHHPRCTLPVSPHSKTNWEVVFGGAASLLVVSYAPYAKHSGIPEIKTMLGGFVIRRFIGTWVLLIKSLGLVSSFIGKWLTVVSCCGIRIMAWKGRSTYPRRLLLRKLLHQILRTLPHKRRSHIPPPPNKPPPPPPNHTH